MTQLHSPTLRNDCTPWLLRWRWLALLLLGWSTGCASLPANTRQQPSVAFASPAETRLGQLAMQRRAAAGARSDSAFHILDSVESAMTSRLALIEGAERSLDLQYYAIHADASSAVLLEGLRRAAQRGVRVRILLDDFNSVGADAQVLRLAFEPNIEMRMFNPLPGPRNNMIARIFVSLHDFGRMQKRMHNKLFIADNAWGIAGGRNLGDRYFGAGDKQNFVDLDVLAAGRIVRDMSGSFDRFWNDELAYPVQSLLDKEELEALRKPSPVQSQSDTPTAAERPSQTASGAATVLPAVSVQAVEANERAPMDLRSIQLTWAPSTLLVDEPGKIGPDDDEVDAGETVIDGLLSLMGQARQDVVIVSPYFVPGAEMMAVYAQLRQRGVRLRVLTNSLASNDAPAAHAGYARYREKLVALGVELYEMRSEPEVDGSQFGSSRQSGARSGLGLGSGPGGSKALSGSRASLHSKAVFIDRRLAVIGSMNLDMRSQKKNTEVGLLIRSAAFTGAAVRQVEQTLATAAWRLERQAGHWHWRAPAGAPFADSTSEPGASTRLKLLVRLLAPFAPDEML